jgi:hypothetical protein
MAAWREELPHANANKNSRGSVIPLHCSGEVFYEFAKSEMPTRLLRSYTGTRFAFEGSRAPGHAPSAVTCTTGPITLNAGYDQGFFVEPPDHRHITRNPSQRLIDHPGSQIDVEWACGSVGSNPIPSPFRPFGFQRVAGICRFVPQFVPQTHGPLPDARRCPRTGERVRTGRVPILLFCYSLTERHT